VISHFGSGAFGKNYLGGSRNSGRGKEGLEVDSRRESASRNAFMTQARGSMEEKAQEQRWEIPVKTWVFVRFENILKKGLARKG
jgi:hypothetical protein